MLIARTFLPVVSLYDERVDFGIKPCPSLTRECVTPFSGRCRKAMPTIRVGCDMLASICWFLLQWAVVGTLALFPLSWLMQAGSGRGAATDSACSAGVGVRIMPFQNS